MTSEEIRAKSADVHRRLREHDAARKLIEAELTYLQHVCPHSKARSWSDGGIHASNYWRCDDCGMEKVS